MADHKNLVLSPNDPPAYVELLFDDPKPFPSRSKYAKPGEQTFKFSVRLLAPYSGSKTTLNAGDEAGFWLDQAIHVRTLSAFRKGDRVKITKYKNPDMSYADLKFESIDAPKPAPKYSEAMTLEPLPEPTPDEQAPEQKANEPVIPPRKTMREALVETVLAINGAADDLAAAIGPDEALAFRNLMADAEVIQKMAVTIYMRG